MRAWERLLRLAGIYVFAAVIGLLGGRIVTAAMVYSQLGWTAMWAEISSWGPKLQPDSAGTRSLKSARS